MLDWTFTIGNVIEISVIVGGGLWTLITMRFNLRMLRHDLKNMELRQQVISDLAKEQHRAFEDNVDRLRSEIGEIGRGLRQKITEVEIYVRDTFVRKETFAPVMTKLETDLKTVGDKIDARLLRIDTKLDTKL